VNEEPRGQIYPIRGGKDGDPPDASPRRLAAIVAGDIAGYSRLMGVDEEGTHARVKRHRRELIEPTISEHQGRLVKYTGDGFLAMFDSPVEAVRCAIVIQQSMVGRNASLPREQWILYRIGVHLGDVIVEHDDIYGEGVNIAARLEGIANPGDVFVSGGVYEQIKNKLVCAYQALGDRQVKNITDPVSVYRVLPDPSAFMRARKGRRFALIAISVLVIAALGSATGFYLWISEQMSQASKMASAPQQPKVGLNQPGSVPTPPPENQKANAPEAPIPQPAPSETTASAAGTPATASDLAASAPAIPVVVSLPGGSFSMGSNDDPSEKPIHRVTTRPFAISKFPITNREWRGCVAAKACDYMPAGNDEAPVTNLSWNDAQQFVRWLSNVTQKHYRLPSEAEWEYAARAGMQTKYWWGDQFQPDMANCKGCNGSYDASRPTNVGSFKANSFGLYDMGGAVDQWVEDCWHRNYLGAPSDGSPWVDNECSTHVIRSGSWRNDPSYVRPASRDHYDTGVRYPTHGFRVALSVQG
jgi:formylglycine-generating enzyme required for sulfatase activity/class 3 adenylate cyclase